MAVSQGLANYLGAESIREDKVRLVGLLINAIVYLYATICFANWIARRIEVK